MNQINRIVKGITMTRDLLFKKFDPPTPSKRLQATRPERKAQDFTAPPFVIAEDEAEVERIRKLLFRKFDMPGPEPKPHEVSKTGSKPFDTPTAPLMTKRPASMARSLKLFILGFILLMALVVKISASNQSGYQLKPIENGVEIWKGIFAPMGQERVMMLSGAKSPESTQKVYSKQEIYPFIFNYYVKRADALLEKPGMPDFEEIKSYLNQAMPYATTDKHRKAAADRLSNIDQMILLYKADVAASKETLADYEAALGYLKQASALNPDGSKADLIKQKVEAINASVAKLKETPLGAESEPSTAK
jgi:hypothetical protein